MTVIRIKKCPYCNEGILVDDIRCIDCQGTGQRCILCLMPPHKDNNDLTCQCGDNRFDEVFQRESRDKGESY